MLHAEATSSRGCRLGWEAGLAVCRTGKPAADILPPQGAALMGVWGWMRGRDCLEAGRGQVSGLASVGIASLSICHAP